MTPLFVPLPQLPGFRCGWALDVSSRTRLVERVGAGPGSLSDDGLRYRVLDGFGVREFAHRLWEWAERVACPIASAYAGKPLGLSPESQAAVNVNVLDGEGERYEPHVDSVSYTMLAFATGPHNGGELVCELPHAHVVVTPMKGTGVLFEGSLIPHGVMPLKEKGPRVSVPIAFEPIGETSDRDPSLSDFLYSA